MNGLPLNFPSIMLPGFYHPNSFSFLSLNTKSVSPRLPQSLFIAYVITVFWNKLLTSFYTSALFLIMLMTACNAS